MTCGQNVSVTIEGIGTLTNPAQIGWRRDSRDGADSPALDTDGRGLPRFTDSVQALAWLDAEYPNLVAIATDVCSAGDPLLGTGLALSLARFLDRRRYFDDWIGVTSSALEHVTRIQQFIDNRAGSADRTPRHESRCQVFRRFRAPPVSCAAQPGNAARQPGQRAQRSPKIRRGHRNLRAVPGRCQTTWGPAP